MDENLLLQIRQRLLAAQNILVICHMRPDGDAIGSLVGLGLALQEAGKQVEMVSVDGVPASLMHLPGANRVCKKPTGEADVVCVVDCSELPRIGDVFADNFVPDINIDHHITNTNFARLNLVDAKAVATAQLVAALLPAIGLKISQSVAEALLTGLITDTIGFRTSNITSEAMRLAAQLMEKGANLAELYRRALLNRSFEAAALWGAGLSNLEREGRMVWATLTWADREATNYPGRDDADLVNVLSAIGDADIVLIFVEQPNGHVKVSWRSQPGFDVSQVALKFAGGGHAAASGADVPGTLEEVRQKVLAETRLLLNKDL